MAEIRKYNDRRQYLIRAVHARRKKVRQMAIEYKGGSCQICGYNRCINALEFHHNNLSEKKFGISAKGYTRSWKEVMKELGKCLMLCANCHRELHARLAASDGNVGVIKRVNSGKAIDAMVNPEPSPALLEQLVAIPALPKGRGRCRD